MKLTIEIEMGADDHLWEARCEEFGIASDPFETYHEALCHLSAILATNALEIALMSEEEV